jgi:hypothetical protein
MTLITDLHPCCKCQVYEDVDTLRIYIHRKISVVLKSGMICHTCRKELYRQQSVEEINALGITWLLHSEIEAPNTTEA